MKKTLRYIKPIVFIPIFGFIALLVWAISSPVGSSPDDDFHLNSIWCSNTNQSNECKDVTGSPSFRLVNPIIDGSAICYAHNLTTSAQCQSFPKNQSFVKTDRGNFTSVYPPVFYAFQSIIAGPNFSPEIAIFLRIFNAGVFVLLASLLYFLLPFRLKNVSLWPWLLGLVPLGMFILASNNPTGWAFISGGMTWLAFFGYFQTTGWRKWSLLSFGALTAFMGAGARADAALFAGLGIIISIILSFEKSRTYLRKLIPVLPIVVLTFLSTLIGNQFQYASDGLPGTAELPKHSIHELLMNNFFNIPSLWIGSFGSTALGWLDTPLPSFVWIAVAGVLFAIIFWKLKGSFKRKIIAIGIIGSALWLIPSWVLAKSQLSVGEGVQPRYIFPLLLMFIGVAMLTNSNKTRNLTQIQSLVVGLLLVVANSVALHTNMRRYISGLDVSAWNLNHYVEWWPIGISPMIVWIIGTLAFAAAAFLILHVLRKPKKLINQ